MSQTLCHDSRMSTISESAYLSVFELSRYLGVSRHTAYMLVRKGAVPSVRVGGQYRIPRVELERRLASQTRASSP
jgi:excisionase family DNA binding protein